MGASVLQDASPHYFFVQLYYAGGSTTARRNADRSSSFRLGFTCDRSFAARGLKGKTQGMLEALPNAHYNAFVYVLALLREVLAKSWQTTAATRLASVARDMFLPSGEADARAHVFAAVQFLLTSNL